MSNEGVSKGRLFFSESGKGDGKRGYLFLFV